jgi:hypothetical protein
MPSALTRTLLRRAALVFAAFAVGAWPQVCRSDSFRVPNSDCLINQCHGAGAALPRLVISTRFDDISGLANDLLLSQHNVAYPATNDLTTIETETANECKKCHGNQNWHTYSHDQVRLYYPDTIGANAVGAAIPRSTNFATYQDFCLSCHDGFDVAAGTGARHQFNGPIPAQQVGPSLRSNPANQQTVLPWVVPAVPPRDVNFAGPNHLNQTPAAKPGGIWYFDYYELNGHGLADSIEGTGRMNVTCLAGSTAGNPVGCHTVHGSLNRFLMDDAAEPGGVSRTVVFGTGLRTAAQFSQFVCLSANCHANAHSAAVLSNPPGTLSPSWVNIFHGGWTGTTGQPSHTFQGGANGMTRWQAWTRNITILAAPPPLSSGLLMPFWNNTTDNIESRNYVPAIGASWLNCLTCHDPHGTALTHFDFKIGPVTPTGNPPNNANTQGMLRLYPTNWASPDALCDQCHAP